MYFFALAITVYVTQIQNEKEKQSKLIDYQMRFVSIGRVIGNISHQWKVPLTRLGAIVTHIESIIHDKNSTLDEIVELIPQIRSNCAFMQNTIDEFYFLYSKDSRKVYFQFSKVIYDVWGMLSAKALASNVKLFVKDTQNIKIQSYEHSFAHIMIILMDNIINVAKKRTITEPYIMIEIFSDNDKVRIIIEDNCGGIEQIPIESIFYIDSMNKNNQVDQNSFGLTIAKTLICEKFFGKITVANIDPGARFIIEIPKE